MKGYDVFGMSLKSLISTQNGLSILDAILFKNS
jgi:hypothetical protein